MPRKSRNQIVGKRAQREQDERCLALRRLSRQLRQERARRSAVGKGSGARARR
jgi:hypothetical protein